MESRLLNLKNDFNNLINIRNNVKNIFEILQLRIDKLKLLYSEFIQNNKNQVFVFGLDSFHFQSKLIDIEYDDTKRLFMAIGNRMYCEYFKLNKIIIEYILNNIKDKKITEIIQVNNYPIYKDLEPFKEYKFETLMDIHENILKMLTILVSELNNKENELSIHKTKQHIGLNIDNFVTTFNFNNNVMKERITMFITYIEFFHKLHTKYLKRFSNKIQLIYTDINNDIKFDESLEINNPSPSSRSSSINKTINQYNSGYSDNESVKSTKSTKSTKSNKSTKSDKSDKIISRKQSLTSLSSSSISSKSDSDETDGIDLDKSVSDEEMNELFLNIESSCESIINKNIVSHDTPVVNETLIQETIDKIDSNYNPDNIELKIEEKEEINTELNDNSSITETNESEQEPEPEPETKKKRTYKPRKKKT
jgi:hypothetical protein